MKSLKYVQKQAVCNLCGGGNFLEISKRDRHDLNITSALCTQCGVIAINPRMSPEDYDDLYQSGENHRLWMELNNTTKVPDFAERYKGAYQFGRKVAEAVKQHIGTGLAVEVGSGTGAVLAAFRDVAGIKMVKGIDPSPEEAAVAEAHGVPTLVKAFELCTPDDVAPETIMSCQSLNHQYDSKGFLEWSHRILPESGTLVLVVLDFFALARKLCSVDRATQVDHIYMFTPDTLKQYVTVAGFDIVEFKEQMPTSLHMTLIAKKAKRVALKEPISNPKIVRDTKEQLARIRRGCFWPTRKRALKLFLKSLYSSFSRA